MYHFRADANITEANALILSKNIGIPGHILQYLKIFQVEAITWLYDFFRRREFCIYNDEGGLGKSATIAALLNATLKPNKKCLVIVHNENDYVTNWRFHLSVLSSELTVTVINDVRDFYDNSFNVYIAKWSNLRLVGDLNKYVFDFIFLDNRGEVLNNNFCISMLLKYYEKKIDCVISSVDITSDLKLMHTVLRLGGRLNYNFINYKIFEDKFQLPSIKDLTNKNIDLETYFLKREKLSDFCRNYRLRRFYHQYEEFLPLISSDRYRINVELWQNFNMRNESDKSVKSVNIFESLSSEKDTEELFHQYHLERSFRGQYIPETEKNISISEPNINDEVLNMSPLFFIADSSDDAQRNDDAVSNNTDIITITSSNENLETISFYNSFDVNLSEPNKNVEVKNTIKDELRQSEVIDDIESSIKNIEKFPQGKKSEEDQRLSVSAVFKKPRLNLNILGENEKFRNRKTETTPSKHDINVCKIHKTKKERKSAGINTNNYCGVLLGSMSLGIKNTRSMQRLTRSATSKNKLMLSALAVDSNKSRTKRKSKNTRTTGKSKKSPMKADFNARNLNSEELISSADKASKPRINEKHISRSNETEAVRRVNKTILNRTADYRRDLNQVSVTPSLEFEDIECGQKLSLSSSSGSRCPTPKFIHNLLPGERKNFVGFTESDIIYVPPSTKKSELNVIVLSEEKEPAKQSRNNLKVTKPNGSLELIRSLDQKQYCRSIKLAENISKTYRKYSISKSPDLFSNCSDLVEMFSQTPLQDFQMIGSDLKKITQFLSPNQSLVNRHTVKRRRSCLELLENICLPRNTEHIENLIYVHSKEPMVHNPVTSTVKNNPRQKVKNKSTSVEVMESDCINNLIIIDSNGNKSQAQQTKTLPITRQQNKITNYLISQKKQKITSLPMKIPPNEELSNYVTTPIKQICDNSATVTSTKKKTPKSLKRAQTTKLTKWFRRSSRFRKKEADCSKVTRNYLKILRSRS